MAAHGFNIKCGLGNSESRGHVNHSLTKAHSFFPLIGSRPSSHPLDKVQVVHQQAHRRELRQFTTARIEELESI